MNRTISTGLSKHQTLQVKASGLLAESSLVNLTHCHSITASRTALSKGQFIGLERSSSSTSWSLTKDVSCDDDNGALIFNPSKPGTSALVTGKISLHGADAPKLVFYYRADKDAQQKVELRFTKKNGEVTDPCLDQ